MSTSTERSGHYAKRVSPMRYEVTVQQGSLDGKLSDTIRDSLALLRSQSFPRLLRFRLVFPYRDCTRRNSIEVDPMTQIESGKTPQSRVFVNAAFDWLLGYGLQRFAYW